jgi:hypothetical protein
MPVPLSSIAPARSTQPRRSSRVPSLGLCAFLMCLVAPLLDKPLFAAHNPPAHRILLEGLGFQPISSRYLLAGSSMLTVHYVDETHLLVTFGARRLIHRVPNDPPTDEDRNVDALLLDLPSGHVVARAEWLLHDHGQYLWNLGQGHFLLRVRDTFTTFAPVANSAHGQSFTQAPFLNSQRHIVAVLLAPDRSLLTIESTEPPPLIDGDPATSNDPVAASTAVQINFYRLSTPEGPNGRVIPRVAGGALARQAVDLPITSAGILNVLDQGRQRWAFDFHPHAGKTQELGLPLPPQRHMRESHRVHHLWLSRRLYPAAACCLQPAWRRDVGADPLRQLHCSPPRICPRQRTFCTEPGPDGVCRNPYRYAGLCPTQRPDRRCVPDR